MNDTNVQATETATGDTNASEQATTETPETNDTQETPATETETSVETTPAGAPDLYVVPDLPEGINIADDARDSLFTLAKKHNLTQDALNELITEHTKAMGVNADAQAEATLRQWESTQKEWDGTLKKDWGEGFEANKAIMDKASNRFITDPVLKEYLFGIPEEGKINAVHPILAKALLEIGKVMSPDTLETGQPQTKQNKNLKDKFSDLNTQYKP